MAWVQMEFSYEETVKIDIVKAKMQLKGREDAVKYIVSQYDADSLSFKKEEK